jgi:hypothetical protein
LKKKTLGSISYLYNILVFSSFFIWGFSVQNEKGLVYPGEHKLLLTIFVTLMFIGMILAGVNLSSVKEKGNSINRKSWITGIVIAFVFIIF